MPSTFKSSGIWVRCVQKPELGPLRIYSAARVAKCHNGTLYAALRKGLPVGPAKLRFVKCDPPPMSIDMSDIVKVPEKTRMPVIERHDDGSPMPINPWRR